MYKYNMKQNVITTT